MRQTKGRGSGNLERAPNRKLSRMKRSFILAVVFAACASTFAVTASAAAPNGHPAAAPAAPKKQHGKFPMPAAEFKNASNERLAKAREKMEEHLKAKKVPAEKAQLMRARFDDVATKVNAAVAKVTADGSVTKDEAKEVRLAAAKARKETRAAHASKKSEPKKGAKDAPKETPKEAPKPKKDDTQEAP